MSSPQVSSQWERNSQQVVEASRDEVDRAIAEIAAATRGAYRNSQPIERIRAASRTKAFDHPYQDRANGFAEFLLDVMKGQNGNWRNNQRMKSYVEKSDDYLRTKALPTGMNETVGADGGFLVAPEFSNQLLMRTYDNDLLQRTTSFPLGTGNTLKIPAINETSRADGSRFGGVYAYWRAEEGTLTASKPALAQVSLTLDSLSVLVKITDEMMADTSGLSAEALINMVVPQEMAFRIGDAIVNGDGVTKPFGITDSSSLSRISISKETGQAAASILPENILKMWARLHASCKKNAVWLVDPSVMQVLPLMTVGTAGSQMVVYMPPGGLKDAPYATLMGRPVIETEFNQTVGTVGDIVLVDLSTYVTVAQGVQAATSMHVYFTSGANAFRFVQRIDGKSWWTSALTPKNGSSATLSNIVTLATRA